MIIHATFGLIRNNLVAAIQLGNEPSLYQDSDAQYLLTPYQLSIYFAHVTNNKAYTIPVFIRTGSLLNADKAIAAFKKLSSKYQILSGKIAESDDGLIHILSSENFTCALEPVLSADIAARLQQISTQSFDLTKNVSDFRVIQVEDTINPYSILSFTHHHIIADGYSIDVMLKDYLGFYNEQNTAVKSYNYSEVVKAIQLNDPTKTQAFAQTICPKNPCFTLPGDYKVMTNSSSCHIFNFTYRDKEIVRNLARKYNTTINLIMLSCLYLTLYRYTKEEYINLGIVFSNRDNPVTANVVGCMVNTLPLEFDFGSESAARQTSSFIPNLAKLLNNYLEYSAYPLQNLFDIARKQSGEKLDVLFNIVFASQYINNDLEIGRGLEKIVSGNGQAKFDLVFNLYHSADPEQLEIEFHSGKYTANFITVLSKTIQTVLEQMDAKPDSLLTDLLLLDDVTYQQQIYTWNQTAKEYPVHKTLVELFEDQVTRTPDSIAVVYENTRLSYYELNYRANQLAAYLRFEFSIKADDLVILCLERSEHILIAILGVMKAGGAYVPLDPEYPDERISYVFEDAKANVLLTNTVHKDRLSKLAGTQFSARERQSFPAVLAIDSKEFEVQLSKQTSVNMLLNINSDNLAYVIYTSGTTGKPKGVMIEHRGVVNLVQVEAKEFELELSTTTDKQQKNCLQYASYVFDAHVWEIFTVISNGHQLHILSADKRYDIDLLAGYIERNNIYIATIPPALLTRDKMLQLKKLVVAGDKTDSLVMKQYYTNSVDVINAYGPTEVTVCATLKHYSENCSSTNIGRPLANLTSYVLDNNLQPLPLGAIGELYIGGVSLSRGYLNRSDLTTEKFIPNPFVISVDKIDGGRLYKTGDLVRYLDNGEIEYIGRNDFQVKIRGFRIELGEIEAALTTLSPIQQSVALAVEQEESNIQGFSNKYLVAYYVAPFLLDETVILKHISNLLPDYMIPNYLIYLDKLPMTINGKLDIKALPKPELSNQGNYVAPRNELEQAVCEIYAKVLNRNVVTIGVMDDFFRLGGSSILAIHLVSRLNKQVLNHKITIAAIFKYRTIATLLENIGDIADTEEVIIPRLNYTATEIEQGQHVKGVLSFAQDRLWFIEHYEGGSWAYNTPLVYEINRLTDIAILKRALISTIERHEVLHSIIKNNPGGDSYQIVMDLNEVPISIEQKSASSNRELRDLLDADVNHIFDLTKEYPIRLTLYNLDPIIDAGQNILDGNGQVQQSAQHKDYLVMVIHHIAFDGWSMDVLLRDLHGYYIYFQQQADDAELKLPKMTIQYRDFASWQRNFLSSARLEHQLSYWRDKLSDYVGLDLTTDYPRPSHISYVGDDVLFAIDEDISIKLRALGQELGVSLYSVMLSGFYLFLRAYSNQNDIVIGSPVANRNYQQLEDLVGFFVNSLVLRSKIDGEMLVADYITQIGADVIEAQAYQDLPFERLVSDLKVDKDQSRHPLFQAMFGVQSFGSTSNAKTKPIMSLFSQFDKYSHREFGLYDDYKVAKLDLTVMINDAQNQLFGSFNYATSLYSKATIERFIETYTTILGQLTLKLHQPIKSINYLNKAFSAQILYQWNDTYADFAREKTLHSLLEEQVLRMPENVALISADVSLSYAEFNNRANQLAHYLISKHGIVVDDMVVLCLERSEHMLVAVQGSLKAGGAYVPMDPGYPDERKTYIVGDTKAKVVLTTTKFAEELKGLLEPLYPNIVILSLDNPELGAVLSKEISSNPNVEMTSRNLAYVIYTSGTTGNPKGVMLEHRGVVNRIKWMNDTYPLSMDDRILQKTPYVFDVSVWELFWAHFYGASIVFAKPDGHKDSNYLIDMMNSSGITVTHFVPSMLSVFEDTLEVEVDQGRLEKTKPIPSLRYIFCSGEALNLSQVQKCHKLLPQTELHNLYGPTEASVDVLYYDCSAKDLQAVYIGKPVYNTTAYVVDSNLNPLPIGAVGELLIGGVQLARGYLNLPEMTAAKFIANPFQSDKASGEHERLYKTGDLVRLREDGNIEYIGRNDFQIKIRGFRVELGEIETALNSFAEVKNAVVLALEHKDVSGKSNGNKYLVGYYVSERKLDENAMLNSLVNLVPDYMVPSVLVHLSVLPVTINGKLDRRALPEPEFKQSDGYVTPRNELEREVCGIYADILGLEASKIGIHDDFFRLGGNSIMAIKLVSRLNAKVFTQNRVNVSAIFKYKTIHAVLDSIVTLEKTVTIPCLKTTSLPDKHSLLSFAQERLWFIEKYEGGSNAYNTLMVYELNHDVDFTVLEQALYQTIKRHEILHSLIKTDANGNGYQLSDVFSYDKFKIHLFTVTSITELKKQIGSMANHIYDLANEYPIQIGYYTLSDLQPGVCTENYLVIAVHHIAFDGWSMDVFLRDLHEYYLYNLEVAKGELSDVIQLRLPELSIQYKDFAAWQRNYLSGKYLSEQLKYWQSKLADYSSLNLVTDYPRPLHINYAGDDVYFSFNAITSNKLRALAKHLGVSLYSVLLGGFYLFLRAYSNQNDIVIGSPIANRNYTQLENLVGFFVNSLALRSKIDPEKTLAIYIQDVGNAAAEAQLYQDLPFEKLINELQIDKDTSRHPLFQVMFGVQHFGETVALGYEAALFKPHSVRHYEQMGIMDCYKVAKFDLTVMLNDSSESIYGSFNYATSLYKKSTIEGFIKTYSFILEQFAAKEELQIKQLGYLPHDDYTKIIYSWNQTNNCHTQTKTIVELFEEQVRQTPDAITLVYEDTRLSYAELNYKANQLGHYLRGKYNLSADGLVALCLNRSEQMLIALLGIMKAGCAYVPIDPDYPDERITYILKDTKATVLLTNTQHTLRLNTILAPITIQPDIVTVAAGFDTTVVLAIDNADLELELSAQTGENLLLNITSHNLAYVIYTSGTTGTPKGVMIEHKGVVNLIMVEAKELDLPALCANDHRKPKNCLQYASYVFDAHVWEIFVVITHGHQLHILSSEKRQDIDMLAMYIQQNHIHVATIPPALLTRDKILKLKKLIVAGDKTDGLVMEEYCKNGVDVINAYGPTEASVCTTVKHYVKHSLSTNIGRPIANFTTYILDANIQPVPVGAIGELYIGGEGLARGYLNKPYVTKDKFIPNPYQSDTEKMYDKNQTLYKSGDLVRYLPDGDIEYIGRNDFQVKIRGFRIELGEIESALTRYTLDNSESEHGSPISQSVVQEVSHKDISGNASGTKYLLAYYVAAVPLDESKVFTYLRDCLPEYMIPNRLIYMQHLPITINGKLDVKSLPEPELTINGSYVAATTKLEVQLCGIYADILGLDQAKISMTDDFFHLGGDSILAIQMVSRIRECLDLIINIKDIFNYKTIMQLSKYIQEFSPELVSTSQIMLNEDGDLSGNVPMLPIQKWFFTNIKNGIFTKPWHWNQSFLMITDELDIKVLECAVLKLMQYHDAMRLGYRLNHGQYEQFYYKSSDITPVNIKFLDRSQLSDAQYQKKLTAWQSDFDLFKPEPLFRVGYICGFSDNSHRVFFALHHLIISTLGWRVISHDIKVLYNKLSQMQANGISIAQLADCDAAMILGSKGTSYRQWVEIIAGYAKNDSAEKLYWKNLIPAIKEYNLMLVKVCGKDTQEISEVRFSLSKSSSEILLTLGNIRYHTQINDLLLSAFGLALIKFSGSTTNYVTLEGHGQENIVVNADVSRTLGWFTTLYPLTLSVDTADLGNTIMEVKQHLADAPNKGIGFGAFRGYKQEELPKIAFNYLGQFENTQDKKVWSIIAEPSGVAMDPANRSPNLIDVNSFASDGKLHFDLRATISRIKLQQLAHEFEQQLNNMAELLQDTSQKYYLVNDFAADFSEVYTIIENESSKNIFILPPGDGGYESYMLSLTPKLKKSRIILFNNYYNHMCSKIDMQNEVNNIDFAFLAKFYIQYIKQIQPHGPYNLFGWSFGGLVSFEISRQLEAIGDKVSFLGMVDSFFDYQFVVNEFCAERKVYINDINYKYGKNNFYNNQSNASIVFFKAVYPVVVEELNNTNLSSEAVLQQGVFNHYINSESNFIERYTDINSVRVIPFESSHYKWVSNPDIVDVIVQVLDA